jgi:membrane protease YdiL (CAAX protease family)
MFTAWLNQQIPLPEWAGKNEENVSGMLKSLLSEKGSLGLLINVFILSFLPALGEEWYFRASLQRIMHRLISNEWLAIIITGFLFSALHFQLEGLLPRFLLGTLLGFIFYKTGNIWISVFLHFLFNAIQVVVAFYSGSELEKLSSEKTDQPSYILVIISLILVIYLVKKTPKKNQPINHE